MLNMRLPRMRLTTVNSISWAKENTFLVIMHISKCIHLTTRYVCAPTVVVTDDDEICCLLLWQLKRSMPLSRCS